MSANDNLEGLPGLEGTEKQVAWANKIREGVIGELKTHIQTAERKIKSASIGTSSPMASLQRRDNTPTLKNAKESLEKVLEKVQSIRSAKWFIDNRNGVWVINLKCQQWIGQVNK